MRINYKFHAIAISVITAVIVVIFMLFGPKEPPTAAPIVLTAANSYVRIVRATWGMNCNVFIESARAVQANSAPTKDAEGNIIPQPVLKNVAPDNVLDNLKSMCDRKLTCESRIDSETLHNEPATECFKRLEVSYRCFEVDRLHTTTVGQGENLKIDCSNTTASNAPANGQ